MTHSIQNGIIPSLRDYQTEVVVFGRCLSGECSSGDQVLDPKQVQRCGALKSKINPTRVSIEKQESVRWLENLRQATRLLDDPGRCVHIGDRERDIYELFCTAQEIGTHFVIRM